jgi:flagellar protein FlaG
MANEIESNVIPLVRAAVPGNIPSPPGGMAVERGQELPETGKALPPEKGTDLSPETLSSAVDNLNEYVQTIRRELEFSIDENSGRTVIKVLDAETKEVIRQIPPEEVVSLSQNLGKKESVIFSKET